MDALQELMERMAVKDSAAGDDEYIGEDGLIHCKVCKGRRETVLHMVVQGVPVDRRVRCLCRCGTEERDRKAAEQAKRETEQRLKAIRGASLMDNKFREARFASAYANQHNQKNLRICKSYVTDFQKMESNNQGLLFWGDVGTGKSFAAACIANELMDRGVSVVMTSFVKLLELIRSQEQEERIINLLTTARLVIFDDLGAERSTEYAIEKVYNIVDSRYRSNRPMLVTTNLTFDDMLDEEDMRYSRIYDRLFEVCYPIQWTGYSWRKAKAQSRMEQMKKRIEG